MMLADGIANKSIYSWRSFGINHGSSRRISCYLPEVVLVGNNVSLTALK
jgi:hypothetical protein